MEPIKYFAILREAMATYGIIAADWKAGLKLKIFFKFRTLKQNKI